MAEHQEEDIHTTESPKFTSQFTEAFAMKQHADRLKNFVLENPFQNDSKFIGLGERNNFNAQNACSSFQKFNKDQPRAGKNCDVNYTINLEPRSVKGGNDCSLTTGSGAIAPLSVVETVDPLDEDYDLLRKKKEELLQIQLNVKNSLETISSKINQTLPSDSDPKEHRRNHAFAVSNPSVKMMKSKYGKASQNLSRNTNKIHNCLKTTHSTNQSNLRGRKGKKKTTRKLENQTFEEKREKHCLKKMSEYTNHATKREDTSPKKAINIMKSFDWDPKFRHPGYLYHNKANEYVYPQQYQSTSVDNRNSSSCSRNGNSVRRDRATRNREASLASGESNAEKSVTSKGKLYKVGSKRNNENKTPVRPSNVTISMKNRDKSRGKSSYKNSYAAKLANMKA